MIYTYPARPKLGHRIFGSEMIEKGYIYRPKVDGSRVMVDVWEQQAFNRHGDHYSKASDLPWDSLEKLSKMISLCEFDSEFGPEYDQGVRWLDVEYLDKHREMKAECVFLDAPTRNVGFGGFIKLLAYSHIPIDSTLINNAWMNYQDRRKDARQPKPPLQDAIHSHGGPMLPEILPRIRWLPYWECSADHDREIIYSLWELLKKESMRLMDIHKESTPFYEGFVSVHSHSPYPRQTRSPKEVYSKWIKHRFSQ